MPSPRPRSARRRSRRTARAPHATRPSPRLDTSRARTTPHDLARLGERADLAERHRLHEQVPEQRRLLRARQRPAVRDAFAVQRQSSSLRAPPPTTCTSAGVAPVDRGEQRRPSRRASARGSRGCSARSAPASLGSGCPVSRRTRGCVPACRRARRRRGRSDRRTSASGGAAVGERDELARRSSSWPSSAQVAAALVQQPEAGDVPQQPERARRRRPRSSGSPRTPRRRSPARRPRGRRATTCRR